MEKRPRKLRRYGILLAVLATTVSTPAHAVMVCHEECRYIWYCPPTSSTCTLICETYLECVDFPDPDPDGGGGTGGSTGGDGGTGGSTGGETTPSNPLDTDNDGRLDCYRDMVVSDLVTASPLQADRNLGVNWGGPNDGVRSGHNGVDIRAAHGDQILAAEAGTVLEVLRGQGNRIQDGVSDPNGNFVRIRHADGSEGVYLHMLTVGLHLEPGTQIRLGQILGTADNTGNSNGDHLHYTRWVERGVSASNPETIHGDCT